MFKSKFFKSTFILIITGFVTKILGFIIKILYTRIIKTEGISLYSLIIPSYSLIITIANMSLPISISKLIAEKRYKEKDIIKTSFAFILIIDMILIFLIFLFKDFISINLLKEPKLKYLFISIIFTIPFISVSSIYKGYFFGKQNTIPNAVSNIFEQILRIIVILWIFPTLIKKGIIYAVSGLIILNVFTETLSIIIFKIYMRKLKFKNPKLNKNIANDLIKVSIPNVSSKIIGNIGFFLEPIILTTFLLKYNISRNIIQTQYGIYNAYTISTLTLPSFFIMAISSTLLPEISKYYISNNNKMVKKRFWQSMYLSLIIGFIFSFSILVFRDKLLLVLYKTTEGSDYIKILAPFFVLFYLEGPLSSTLQALNNSKNVFKISLIGIIIKLSSMIIFIVIFKTVKALVYSEIINILFVVFASFYYIQKEILFKENHV